MRKAISIDVGLCTGCRNCELACSARNTRTFNPRRSRVVVLKEEPRSIVLPMVCLQCEEPLCRDACPAGAIVENSSGALTVNQERCIGCHNCVTACVYGGIFIDPVSGKALKCDLCDGKPACVKACEYKAISMVEISEEGLHARSSRLVHAYEAYQISRKEAVP